MIRARCKGIGEALGRQPTSWWVAAACVFAWGARAFFLALPVPLMMDEPLAITACASAQADTFRYASTWAERWQIISLYGAGGRILSTFSYVLWGMIFPSNGTAVFTLSLLAGILAACALAQAARHLYGAHGFTLCFLLTSLSPLFLNYTISVLATIQMAMWISLALYFFTRPGWTILSWIAGGLCLGLSFASHYGAGPAVLGIAAGLAAAVVRLPFRRAAPVGKKLLRATLFPLVGLGFSLLPLYAIERWAQTAGQSYFERFIRWNDSGIHLVHENLSEMLIPGDTVPTFGTYGLWLRILFELEPIMEALFFAAVALTFRKSPLSLARRIVLTMIYVCIISVLVVGMNEASVRSWFSIAVFAIAGLAIGIKYLPARATSDEETLPPATDSRESQGLPAPLDSWSVVVTTLTLIGFLTFWRPISGMSRLVFSVWPLFMLALVGILVHTVRAPKERVLRMSFGLGTAMFLIGLFASYRAKTAPYRDFAYAQNHPGKVRIPTANLSWWSGVEGLLNRGSDDIAVIGPPVLLYPLALYESEPLKLKFLRQNFRKHGLEKILRAESLLVSTAFTDSPEAMQNAPTDLYGTDSAGKRFHPRTHPIRGYEISFSSIAKTAENAINIKTDSNAPSQILEFKKTLTFNFARKTDQPVALEFEAWAYEPFAPSEIPVKLEIHEQGNLLHSLQIVASNASAYEKIQIPIQAAEGPKVIHITATLTVAPGPFYPPLTCYIRNPVIKTYTPPTQ